MKPALVLDLDETIVSSSILRPSSECPIFLKDHHSNLNRPSSNKSSQMKRQSVPNMAKKVQKIDIDDNDSIDLIRNDCQPSCSTNSYELNSQQENNQIQNKSYSFSEMEDYSDQSICFPIKFNRRRVYVTTRPGLQRFYSTVKKMFDIYFFTSSEKKYADQIIDFIDDQVPHERRFFRDSCICYAGYYVKDLSILKRDIKDIVLLDDTEGCALKQPKNLIRVNPWYGYSFSPLPESPLSLTPILSTPTRTTSIPDSSSNIDQPSDDFINSTPCSVPPQSRRKSHNDVKPSTQMCTKIDNELNGRILPLLIKFSQEFYMRHSMDHISEIPQFSQISHSIDSEIKIQVSAT